MVLVERETFLGVPIASPSENEVVLLAKDALQSGGFCSFYPFSVGCFVRYWLSGRYREVVGSMRVVYPEGRWLALVMGLFGRRRVRFISPAGLMMNLLESIDGGGRTILCLGLSQERYKTLKHRMRVFFPRLSMEGSLSRSLLRSDVGDCMTLLRKLRPTVVLVDGDLPMGSWPSLQSALFGSGDPPLNCLLFCSKALRRYSKPNKRTGK